MPHTPDCTCVVGVSLPVGVEPDEMPPVSYSVVHCRLHRAAPELLEEGQKLANEVRGMLALLKDHAGVIGWTNIACLCQRLDNFDAAIAKTESAQSLTD